MRVPKYRRHPNGQAFIEHRSIPTPDHRQYLGVYGSEKSVRKYQAFLKGLEAAESGGPGPATFRSDSTIAALVVAYLRHCEVYYRHPSGKNTKEFSGMVEALRPMVELFGDDYARTFGPKDLETYRNLLIRRDMARTSINKHAGRVRRMFRWAASKEILPASVWHGLAAVEGLKKGRTAAREPKPIPSIPWEQVELVLPYLSPVVGDMVQTQYWCGMRPQDVCGMRRCDIDQSSDVWLYRPPSHKGAWRGHSLIKAIPQRVQPIVRARFKPDANAYLFSPRDAVLWHAEQTAQAAARTTRTERDAARRHRPSRHRDHYTTDTYRQAVEYGLERLNAERAKNELPPIKWAPNQLRHGIATYLERTQGRQSAQRYLGHKHLSTTELYVEKDAQELIAIARELDARLRAVGQAAIDGAAR